MSPYYTFELWISKVLQICTTYITTLRLYKKNFSSKGLKMRSSEYIFQSTSTRWLVLEDPNCLDQTTKKKHAFFDNMQTLDNLKTLLEHCSNIVLNGRSHSQTTFKGTQVTSLMNYKLWCIFFFVGLKIVGRWLVLRIVNKMLMAV